MAIIFAVVIFTIIIGVSTNAISKLIEHFGKWIERITKPTPPPPPIPWNVPHSENKFFTGRKEILKALRSELSTKGAVALSQTSVISGLGGIGKTQTAVEFAFQNRSRYSAVLWSQAQSTADLISGFAAIARELKVATFETNEQEAVEAALSWLNANSGWLLILDNADEPQLVERFIPTVGKGHVLVTSRAHDFSHLGIIEPMELEKMLPHEAVDFLRTRTGRERLDTHEAEACRHICKELDYLPLALEQAGAYIHKQGISFKAYQEQYKKDGLKIFARLGPQTGQYPESVLTTWLMNFMQVEEASPASTEVLRVSAFLASEGVCLEIFGLKDEVEAANVLTPLVDYSLISRERGARDFDVHRLVQTVVRLELGDRQKEYATLAVAAMKAAFPDPSKFENWGQCDRLLPHAISCYGWVKQFGVETREAAVLLNQAVVYLWQRGRYAEAEPLHKRSLEVLEKTLGSEHPDVATGLNNLAMLYDSQGRYAEAEPLYKRSLEIDQKAYGLEHPEVATDLNNLAALYDSQGRYAEAEPLYKRSLDIWEKALPDHPNLARSLENYALLLEATSRPSEASTLRARAAAIRAKHTA